MKKPRTALQRGVSGQGNEVLALRNGCWTVQSAMRLMRFCSQEGVDLSSVELTLKAAQELLERTIGRFFLANRGKI
jgi:hypothetical protein